MTRARAAYGLWIAGILALFCLHCPHLLADFPNHSPWMDYSKYTDEGWYANAAIRYTLTGHWHLRGDFNPAVALPVWPLLLTGVFHYTGVSLAAARGTILVVFGLDLLLAYAVIRTRAEPWAALLAVTLLAANPFLYAFSRLALLEPLLLCVLLLTWLLALQLPRVGGAARLGLLCAIGVLLWVLILVKTTGVFVLPSTLFLIAAACGFRMRESLRALAVTATAAALMWCLWYFLLVRPHYRADFYYVFAANQWPQPATAGGWVAAFWWALHGVLWVSPALCALALVLLIPACLPFRSQASDGERCRRLWRNPLIGASLLTVAGYIFFAGWHNSPQPRYYQMAIYPLCFIVALEIADLLRRGWVPLRALGGAALAAVCVVCVAGAFRIVRYVRHPEYTWVNAARGVTRIIDQHPGNRLLLSISGDNIALLTHVSAICDDYGTWDLPYRMHQYRPGWYAEWNEIDPGTLIDLEEQYSLHQVAEFPAFDDPDRNLLILYRLDPLPAGRQRYSAAEEAEMNANR